MKLHYSQTSQRNKKRGLIVLVPYEITLLSNDSLPIEGLIEVLVPYEITLLSNLKFQIWVLSK